MKNGVVCTVVFIGMLLAGLTANPMKCSAQNWQGSPGARTSTRNSRDAIEDTQISGVYRNREYGYLIQVPHEYRGSSAPPPAPQHGLRIDLSGSGENFIWVDGSYNAAEYKTASQVAEISMETIRNQGGDIQEVSKSESRLGALSAACITVHYRIRSSGETRVNVSIVALRSLGNENERTGIVYSIGLSCSEQQYKQEIDLFNDVVKSWRIQRISLKK
jgi:hypothetical protein